MLVTAAGAAACPWTAIICRNSHKSQQALESVASRDKWPAETSVHGLSLHSRIACLLFAAHCLGDCLGGARPACRQQELDEHQLWPRGAGVRGQ